MIGTLVFEAPCCWSIRSCRLLEHLVISLKTEKILRRIGATRCYRGVTKTYRFYPTDDVSLVEVYVSNRGVWHLKILWKPEGVQEDDILAKVRRALGIEEEEAVVSSPLPPKSTEIEKKS